MKFFQNLDKDKIVRYGLPIVAGAMAVVVLIVALASRNAQSPAYSNPEGLTIFLDAGHGGYDVGAQSGDESRNEKDDNLKLALKVQEALEKQGVNVVMTRTEDVKVELEDVCKKANESGADFFVSLHRNSSTDDAQGVEIWIKNTGPEADTMLAQAILDKLEDVGISSNRGVRTGLAGNANSNYYVNRNTNMPSCLVELGFMTSDTDNKLFDRNLNKYASAIAEGILEAAHALDMI
ncbi:MAG: N-acetylmuramoyl-L-alanine amidase [Clostridiales bacterium]|nr:N-acetylmuramoyl-L-alanine amidase [Clostridiales bacterium]